MFGREQNQRHNETDCQSLPFQCTYSVYVGEGKRQFYSACLTAFYYISQANKTETRKGEERSREEEKETRKKKREKKKKEG